MSNTDSKLNTVEWSQINWRKVEKSVFKLQKRIYRACQSGNIRAVRKLQKTLTNSYYAKLLAVRRVSQDNQGTGLSRCGSKFRTQPLKKTAGVDKVKSLTPTQRFELVRNLKLGDKAKPVRRVWIPKNNREKRPLGIPTMADRATQALVKMAIEPEWEVKFEPNSYGFRPGRSCHDAIEAIFNAVRVKPKYVLDADIAKCFDRINHKQLLKKLNTYPKLRRQIKAWLKAGVMDNGKKLFPEEGTPQGGVISPMLANIALHGMEERIKEYAATWKGRKRNNQYSLNLIRYADDFVILHEKPEVIQQCKQIIEKWLKQLGLALKLNKTRITHTLEEYKGEKPGFDFLGFNVRQYKVSKYKSGKSMKGFKTIIKPSKEKVMEHYHNLAKVIDNNKAVNQLILIGQLNPIIRGWSNYYRTVCSKDTFSKLNHLLTLKLLRWAKRRHPRKGKKWVKDKYWHTSGDRNWVFAEWARKSLSYVKLLNHADTPIARHVKVKGDKSPYDGDNVYWAARMGKNPEIKNSVAKLLKRQKGKCNKCGLFLKHGDKIEEDHIIANALGGDNTLSNSCLLHRHCHDSKTKEDLRLIMEAKLLKEQTWKWKIVVKESL
jgi:RNA-directed DNA polymerase